MWSCSPLRATINLGLWHILHGNANKIHQIINFRPKQVSTKIAIAQFVSEKSLCLSDSFLMTVILYTIVNFSTCLKSAWLPPMQQPRKMPQSSQLVIMQYFTMCSAHTPGVWPICTFYLFWGALYWTHLPIPCLQLTFLEQRCALLKHPSLQWISLKHNLTTEVLEMENNWKVAKHTFRQAALFALDA